MLFKPQFSSGGVDTLLRGGEERNGIMCVNILLDVMSYGVDICYKRKREVIKQHRCLT